MRPIFWRTLACSLGYLLLAMACLVQWHGASHWEQLDWFAGSYFALRFVGSLHSILSSWGVFHSKVLREEWWALNSDPTGPRWVMLLMALDLTVFLDYGHWRLTPRLIQPEMQIAGAGLYLAITLLQIWTDSYLARFFNPGEAASAPMNHGPYRLVRHPRYAAAIIGKVAMALIFGSLFGWLLVFGWGALLLNKISVEERYLRKVFGSNYEAYARTTAKVIPGIY